MANLGASFDPNAVEPDAGRDLLPEGEYTLSVIDSDVVPTKGGTGLMLKLTLEVQDGPFSRRRVWENLNIQNANTQAQEIAQRQLSALCRAAGITQAINDSNELHYQPFRAKVGVEPAKGEFKAKNKVTRYIAAGEPARPAPVTARPAPTTKPATAPAATRPAANGARPWAKSA